jgi:NADPH:quinone reductase-like Zn-dependent oxidoreductase
VKLRNKIAITLLAIVSIAVASLAFVMSYDSACSEAPPVSAHAGGMKAVVYRCYGSPDVLALEEVEKPAIAANEVLVRVHAASVNPLDWHYMRGSPYIMRMESGFGAPKETRLGVDFAGTVEAIGSEVKRFSPGDEVFGGRTGAFGEYVKVREDRAIVLKPPNVSFEQAASVPIAAITALQALRDKGELQAGQSVLINGASGGVGTFAVQIARSFGAEVSGVCSTRNLELVRSLGADHVIDYTKEDFMTSGKQYDLIIDNVGNRPLTAYRKVLKPTGIFVIVGGPDGRWLGPLINPLMAMLISPFVNQDFVMLLARMDQDDLAILSNLLRDGTLTPVIDREFPLDDVAAAIRYSEEGHARGKIVIRVN